MQDVNADSLDNELFSDAMIAEMEADIYGLQVWFLLSLPWQLMFSCFIFYLFIFFTILKGYFYDLEGCIESHLNNLILACSLMKVLEDVNIA